MSLSQYVRAELLLAEARDSILDDASDPDDLAMLLDGIGALEASC